MRNHRERGADAQTRKSHYVLAREIYVHEKWNASDTVMLSRMIKASSASLFSDCTYFGNPKMQYTIFYIICIYYMFNIILIFHERLG